MTNDTIGLIGPGSMGIPMAKQLIEAGRTLYFVSRSPKPELIEAGGIQISTAKELASKTDAVLSMLPDIPQLGPFLTGEDSLLAAHKDVFLMIGSTSSPVRIRQIAAQLDVASNGHIQVVDVPVSGGVEGAKAGTLSIMMGGTDAQFSRATQLLSPCGTVHHLGPLGAGAVAKACNQMIVGATMLALGEATVLAERSGIDTETLMTVLGGGYAGSTLLESKKHKLIADDYRPDGAAEYIVKDLGFANDVAEETKTNTVLLPTLLGTYRNLVDQGYGPQDLAVAKQYIEQR